MMRNIKPIIIILCMFVLAGCVLEDEEVAKARKVLLDLCEIKKETVTEHIYGRELLTEYFYFDTSKVDREKVEEARNLFDSLPKEKQKEILNSSGDITKRLRLLETAYKYLDEYKQYTDEYGLSDLRACAISNGISKGNRAVQGIMFESDLFEKLPDENKLTLLSKMAFAQYTNSNNFPYSVSLRSGEASYSVKNSDSDGQYYTELIKDGEEVLRMETEASKYWAVKSGKSSTGKSFGSQCPNCGGLGYVKWYYGESALDAFLNGEPDYTLGKCPLCHGTGKIDN